MSLSGWNPDPFGTHEERFFKLGEPTPLVRDNGIGSYDEPPLSSMSTPPPPPTAAPMSPSVFEPPPPPPTAAPMSPSVFEPPPPAPIAAPMPPILAAPSPRQLSGDHPRGHMASTNNVIWRTERSLARLVTTLRGNVHFNDGGIFRRGQRLVSWADVGWIEVEDRLIAPKGSARQNRARARQLGGSVLRHRYMLLVMSSSGDVVLRIDKVALPRVAGLMYSCLRQSRGIQPDVETPPDRCERCGDVLTIGLETVTREGLVGIFVVPTTGDTTALPATGIGAGLQALVSDRRIGRRGERVAFVDQAVLCTACQEVLNRYRPPVAAPSAAPRVVMVGQYDSALRSEMHRHNSWTGDASGGQSQLHPLVQPQAAVLVPAGTIASRPSLGWLTGAGGAFVITLNLPSRVSGIVAGKGRADIEIVARGDRLLAPDGFDTPTLGEYQAPVTIAKADRAREYWIETPLYAGVYVVRRRSNEGGMLRRILASFASKAELSVVAPITAIPIDGLRGYEEYEAAFRAARRHAWRRGSTLPALPVVGCLLWPILVVWGIVRILWMIGRLLFGLVLAIASIIRRAVEGRMILTYAYNGRGIYRRADHGFVLWKFWDEMTDHRVARFFARHSERRDPVRIRGAIERAVTMLVSTERLEEASALRVQAMERFPTAA